MWGGVKISRECLWYSGHMKRNSSQKGSVLVVAVVVAAVLVLGGLGYVLWSNFISKEPDVTETISLSTSVLKTFCEEGEDITASKGTFCSEDIGIKFEVPLIFAGKIEKTSNYEVFQGGVYPSEKQSAGMSERVYSVVISGNDNFSFTIAQEPLRSGNIDFPYLMGPSDLNAATGKLVGMGGEEVVPFRDAGIVVYKGGYGDAGQLADHYLLIVKDKIVKIVLQHTSYMGPSEDDPATIDEATVFEELNGSIKNLVVIE